MVAGLLFCFRGYWALRLIIAIWGAFVGFGLGAGIAAAINDESYLASAAGWVLGIVLAVIFSLFAYLYYAVGVIIALASIGFTLGATVTVALGVSWNWVIVAVGIVCGVLLALLAIAADLPNVVLVVLSALAGSIATVAGVMLLVGSLDSADFSSSAVTTRINDDWWWYASFVALALVGMFAQSRATRAFGGARAGWSGSGRAGNPR